MYCVLVWVTACPVAEPGVVSGMRIEHTTRRVRKRLRFVIGWLPIGGVQTSDLVGKELSTEYAFRHGWIVAHNRAGYVVGFGAEDA